MGKAAKYLIDRDRHYKELLKINREAANRSNSRVMKVSLIAAIVILSLSFVFSFFSDSVSYMRFAYVIAIMICIALSVLLKFSTKIPILFYVYAVLTIMVSYATLSSALLSPSYVCVTILAIIFQFPVMYVDRGWRINTAVVLSGGLYLISIVGLKDPFLLGDEIANVGAFVLLGCIIGRFTRRDKLDNFEMKRQLHLNAYTDALTGLLNRRSFFERITESEKKGCVSPITALAMLDLDNFKSFNDIYGHQAGDECLATFGKCLLEYESKFDIKFYRYGGEEFVASASVYSKDELFDICCMLRQSVSELKIIHNGEEPKSITVSIGVAAFSDCDEHLYTRLLSKADIAVYAAKNTGKNKVVQFESEMEKDSSMIPPPSYRLR